MSGSIYTDGASNTTTKLVTKNFGTHCVVFNVPICHGGHSVERAGWSSWVEGVLWCFLSGLSALAVYAAVLHHATSLFGYL